MAAIGARFSGFEHSDGRRGAVEAIAKQARADRFRQRYRMPRQHRAIRRLRTGNAQRESALAARRDERFRGGGERRCEREHGATQDEGRCRRETSGFMWAQAVPAGVADTPAGAANRRRYPAPARSTGGETARRDRSSSAASRPCASSNPGRDGFMKVIAS